MEELFQLADMACAHVDAEQLFDHLKARLSPQLPLADIRHIGATAIPGCLTKGDLDVVVRVSSECFALADVVLARMFIRNNGSIRNETFAAFEDPNSKPHLGIQLVTRAGPYDFFHHFCAALRQSSELLEEYNDLKRRYDGAEMDIYRAAKDKFVSKVLN